VTDQKTDSLTCKYHKSTIPDLSSATLPEHRASLPRIFGIGTLAGASFLSTLELKAAQPPEPPPMVRNIDVEQRAEFKEISGPKEVLQVFDPDVHVYISRNTDTNELPVPQDQLKELAEQLAKSGNYVVIVGKAAKFVYTTNAGEKLVGKEAVYRQLGQELFDLPAFRKIADDRVAPTTKSASLFVLTCDPGTNNKDRDWFMSASSLHERFNISDEKDWKGGASYGMIAVPYFQSRKFSDGIVATVKRIDQDLNAAIRGERIAELRTQLDQLAQSSQAFIASSDLAPARDLLERVHAEWQEKGPTYPEMLRDAEAEVGKIALTISAAENAAARSRSLWNMLYGFIALISAAAAAGVHLVNRRVQDRKKEASNLLENLQQGMKKKEEGLEALERLKGRALASHGGAPASFPEGSLSGTLAREACEALEKLWLFQIVANEEITRQAAASIAAGGVLSSFNYDRAIEIMTQHPIEFSEDNRGRIEHAFSEQRSAVASLTVPIKELATFRKSMAEVDSEFIRLARVATENFETIEDARTSLSESLGRIMSSIRSLQSYVESLERHAETDSQTNILTVPEVREILIPLLQKKFAQFDSEQTEDPVKERERLALASEQITQIQNVLAALVEKRATTIRKIEEIEITLSEAGLRLTWIADEIASISASVGEFVVKVTENLRNSTEISYEDNGPDISQLTETLEARAHQAVKLESRRSAEVITAIRTCERRVQSTREGIARALSLNPNQILVENNANPDSALEEAKALELDVQAALSKGDLELAETRISESLGKVALAKGTVDATQQSFDCFTDRLKLLSNAEQKIADSLPSRKNQLEQLKSRFKEAALEFFAGDLAREHADDTVANNISEIEEAKKTASSAIQNAGKLRQQGKILQSANELMRAGESYIFCEHRLAEIEAKHQSLNALSVNNQKLQVQALATHRKLAGDIESDTRITEATRAKLDSVSTSILDSIEKLSNNEKTNPLEIQRQLMLADEALQTVRNLIGEDINDHKQATDTIDKLRSAVDHALSLAQRTEQNEIPDSKATDDGQHRIEELSKDFQSLRKEFSEAERANWSDFSIRSTKIHGKISEAINTIEREDKAGVKALDSLNKSRKHISQVSRWSGSHGVTINGSPGKSLLEQAMKAFGNAEYNESLQLSKEAFRAASSALERAESEVAAISARIAREQEEARQLRAAERRRQAQNQSSSDDSYGGLTSSWSSSSGGSIFGGNDSSGASSLGELFDSGSSGGTSLGGFFDSGSSGGTSLGGSDGAGW
jgi:hypothetical protein